jgi:hypothetical protein
MKEQNKTLAGIKVVVAGIVDGYYFFIEADNPIPSQGSPFTV